MKLSPSVFAAVVGLSLMPIGASADNFAGSVINSTNLSTNSLFSDPTAALGQPTTLANDTFGDISHASMANPAYGIDENTGKNLLVTFKTGATQATGQLTVQLAAPITHNGTSWYNQDFIVFSNQGFIGGPGFASDGTDMAAYQITDGSTFGALPQVSVSSDGTTFYPVMPSSSFAIPENPYHWDGLSAGNTSGWGVLNDFSKPVNPNLTAANFAGKSVADADNILYNGSAGGTPYTFAQTGLTTIDYIRFSANPTGSAGVVDGIAAVGSPTPVPEAGTFWSFLIGLLGLAGYAIRRRKANSAIRTSKLTKTLTAAMIFGLFASLPGVVRAQAFMPQITQTVGSGSSESFFTLDFQDGTADHNYAFGYLYNGARTGADMVAALTNGAGLNVGYVSGYAPGSPSGVLVNSFSYNGHSETGSNNDYWSYWLSPNGQDWKFSGVGASGRTLANGSWDGWSWDANNADRVPVTPAAVPEAATFWPFLLGLTVLAYIMGKKRLFVGTAQ